ncbi:dynein heavy chain 5, axonemal [Asbolus verrucosus]|uniref:Dynein heavy chain 5, axonemal n=1 Tax=Asbolus verrucosus TaxID=1661398 RepID=A0A482W1Z8_ASBVE|nr:dynein heavy chain 5, axonemal [Asbolus verrucosus]
MFVYGPQGHYSSESETESDLGDDPELLLVRRREECERKARRGEIDPRLEFAFQLLMDGTGLPRHEVMDYVFEGDMLDEINQLFLPYMKSKLMWFYQDMVEIEPQPVIDPSKPSTSRQAQANVSRANVQQIKPTYKKKLFLTDGWDVPLTGICIYIFRTNTAKQLPEEGFHKDLFCGIIDAKRIGLITTVERIIEHVFMEALAHPSPDCEDDTANCPMVKNQLLPGLRSFCSALKVCEEVCNEGNLFDDGGTSMSNLIASEIKDMANHPEKVAPLEDRVKSWCKRLTEILKESEQVRRENDSSGPQDELEYWKKRGAQFSQISSQVNSNEVQMTILCLRLARSKTLKEWAETDKKITFCYNEAKDNAKFIQALEKNCHALYLDDPVKMRDSILGLLQTVRLIHSISQFYNTSERTSALMVKITNQMIETCKEYVTCRNQETIWSQDRTLVKEKLTQCIVLNKVYRKTYNVVKNQPFIPGQQSFNFSENYVFGKFDAFCRRLSRIIAMFDLIDDYNSLFQRRMEGLLLGDALEEAIQSFNEIKSIVMDKKYDYLDQRNAEFNADFKTFLAHTDELKENIGGMIEKNFDSVWETPQGIRFLTRFEKVSEKIPLTRMDDKYDRILKYCEKEVDRIIKMYKKQKDDPPVPIMFPPIAGRIKWAKSLLCHLDELLSCVTTHHVLKNLPATAELSKRHKAAETTLKSYETDMVAIWMNQHICDVDNCLKRNLLAVCPEQQRLKVNLHPTIPLLIREADLMIKMDLPIPMVALTLYSKQEHFGLIKDHLQFLIEDLLTVVRSVKLEVRPLFLPHLVKLTDIVAAGLNQLTWVSSDWKDFIDRANEAIKKFKVLTERIHDVYTNRVLEVLATMQAVQLHALPEVDEEPWTIDFFCDKMDDICRSAATELHRKSLMVEEAVEEILTLVRKARIDCPSETEDDLFSEDEADKQTEVESSSTQQQSDWSLVWECFEKPHLLLSGGMSKAMEDMVRGAVSEMRRYYSRKVVDVLVRVTKQSLEALRRRFSVEYQTDRSPVFVLNSVLLIPKVAVQPNLEEVQEVLNLAGKNITSVSKGVGQWTGGRPQKPGKGPVKTKEEDFRTRRRRLYRLATEEKPMFPFQQKNFHSFVMENKEVMKTLSLLSNCTQDMKQEMTQFIARWRPYNILWRNEKSQRELLNACLTEFETSLRKHDELNERLTTEPDIFMISNCLAISTEKLKYGLVTEINSCTHRIGQAMKKKYRREMDYVYAVISEMERKLERTIRDLDDVRLIMDTLKKIREQEVDMELKIDPIEDAFNVLNRHNVTIEKEILEQVDSLRYTWGRLQENALKVHVNLLDMQPQFQQDLRSNLEKFRQDKIDYCNEYKTAGPMQPGLTPREASDKLILFQNRFDGMWRKLQTYQSGEELFGLPTTDYPDLAQIRKELNLLQKLYKLYNDVIDRVTSYYDIPWGEVNIEEINNELMEFQNRCRKLPKGLKEWPAFFALKKTIDDFNDMCPLLELMANKAMKPRHWQRIMDSLNHIFEFESEGFCLKNILEAPLLQHKEDIEDICISAMKEKDIEAKLRQVTNEWSVHELTFMTFNNRGELLLRGDTTAETIGQLEDSLMVLGSLLSNRYNAPFRKQIQQWVHDLSNTNEILERWLLVQNMWVYLEAVFVGGDIAKQLPKEAKRFSKIDKSWQKIMQRAHETPGVVACCVGDDLLKQLLPHLQEQLELCQKSLSGYLERKRMMFPRFFFVSDPALLEILGQASDSHTIQNHLLSIFDNTRWVKFHDIEYNKITAIISSEGELIQLEKAVRAEGSVETWLTQLLVTSQTSLHSIIRQAFSVLNDANFQLLLFLEKMPAQIGLLGLQMIWTRDAELALIQARHDKKVMSDTNNKFLELLNTLIDQTTRDLTKIERTKFETLITIHVHQRDIFDILCRLNVRHVNDFEWLKQCRFYFKEEVDKTLIIITDVSFSYQNEYLGCTDRLVITPLTDRCYITLAQALAMSMGGAPCGPAGTGKTETVKDMGKTLAKYVVVFNCSDQMDYRGLGRIYKGLAQSGSWGCFDEFNRIELPVLSVAAQQVAVVLASKREKRKNFQFTDGDIVEMCPEFGIFITMNPGYAGRKELPENLKIQFRTVAMMVPDRQIIIRVKLASCGFLENITLARKFYTLYKLCEEQLTKQVHYDFGLRNILSVLRSLGAAKRVNNKDTESTIVMRVLRDMNLSKLIDEDEPLFISLVADLFPNQALEKTAYPELEEAINTQVEEAGLINHPSWALKLIQLYETQRVRHGIMTLGPTGAGKTTCIQILMRALTQMGKYHSHNSSREMRMNPKSITAAQMFGRLDVATNDWNDGIFSALWRKTLKLKSGEYVWLVLDGPVDSIWIENLNSVLDDNKTLTLANGDRLSMAPTCKIIFEPHNIDNASPATVSRNGMVYMSSSGLNWKPVVRAWLKKRSLREQELFQRLFDESYGELYNWGTQNLSLVIDVLECNITLQMLKLLEGLVPAQVEDVEDSTAKSDQGDLDDDLILDESEKVEENKPFTIEHLSKLYVFALVWGMGAFLEIEDRNKYDVFLKENLPDLDLPKNDRKSQGATVFDYVVNSDGEWVLWSTMVTNYIYPELATPEYATILIPIPDNVRINYLINTIAKQEKAVLLVGEQGTAKTVMMKSYMKNINSEVYLNRSFNFSSATSPYQFQKTIESYIGTLSTVIESDGCCMVLWKHECTRMFSDRFTIEEDKEWFNAELLNLVEQELGDAPEPTGEEGEDADMELPKVYEPVTDESELRERLDMFLAQFNEMVRGSGMDLVFFPDAMLHLVKISRVIRHPRGNVMLVGVGGSGKQSLTKLSSFIAGYKTFQITLTRSYNIANFLEDLKVLYRSCGCQGKGTTFIFTDLDIKEEGFLEYLNNILSSGVISNLFTKDEQAEIIQEVTPVMKRENPKRTINPESVMEYFMNKTCQNLHVVFCFSPVGEKFRSRALRFPALISGCTIDWFQPWPKDALVSVARHFLTEFKIACTDEVKEELVTALGSIQDVVSITSVEYFQRFRRATHVTPKSYLNFIAGYKSIYKSKKKELSDGALKMDTGLEKLAEASSSVLVLKKELASMEKELAVASKRAEKVLTEVTERAMQAEIVKNQVQKVKEKAEVLVSSIAAEKALAEEKLEAAKPALEEAEAALNTIKPAHIATVRKLGRPPHLIMRIMDCVLILFQRKLHPVIVDVAASCPKPSWPESLKMMASTTFLLQLQNYPKDIINNEMVEFLQPYFEMEDYNMDTAKRVCGDVAGLLSWTKAMAFFHSVNREVLPLKANLTLQEARLKVAMEDLAAVEQQLEEREQSLREVKEQYDTAVLEKQRLTDAANSCLRKMNTATTLINGLGGRLVGDVLLATGFLSYCGPYNQEFRANLVSTWMDILQLKKIPYTVNLNITNMLVESATLSEWTLQGLPNDELSVQNALIVTKSRSYPLLIDPQNQGKMWIKNKEANNNLQITSLNHKYFRTHLEDCLSLGKPLLIEDIDIELDPVLDNVLEKNFIKSGSIEKVIVGDKECDVLKGFMLYITTKLPNPPYSPEISAKTSIIDFTVTMLGLEDQLLGRVILMEKSDLEAERVALFECVMQNQKRMKELETNLLSRLNSSECSLVEDEELINVLQVTKTTAEEVNQKLSVSVHTEKKINIAREEFRAVAARGSILYFLIVEMSNVNVMYQNSLKQFLIIFDNSITKSEKSADTIERINIILHYLTREVIKFDCVFTKGLITHEEFMAFIKGGASLDLNAVAPKPFRWILDITWLNLVEINKLATFSEILIRIEDNEKEWKFWYEKEKPEEEEIPCGYHKSLDVFRKLLLIRSWSPDRTLSQARKYIMDSLGAEYGEPCILDLEATWSESEARTPLICILSIGSDPSPQIATLAKAKEMNLKSVSMGQGQEVVARDMIEWSMQNGGWVLLQNIHLSLPFATEAMTLIIDTEEIHENFRIWLTTEVHEQFPIGLLQMAIKFTNEPPQGIRASMKRTYQNITQDYLDYSAQSQWPPLLYAVAFLHTVVQERRKFGPLGWNVPYEFNQADFGASVQFIQNHLDDMDPKKGVSWPTVCYMLGEVQYGGRVTDDFDKRLLTTFTQVWFCDVLLRPGFEFYRGYKVPQTRNLQGYVDYINSLPATDTPEVFGLHANADITYQINTAKGILDTILSVQPKEGGSQGGETRESVVYSLAEDMLAKLPEQYNSFEVKEALQRMGALLPMNIFLRQEIDRIQKVLKEVQSTLCDLKLAIDGTIVMSQGLRRALDAMYDARIPEKWEKISWESATLGFWYTELLERDAQFRTWCNIGKPNVFWMTGFFNPQGFLTAMRQDVTRAHKGWALDSVVLQNLITRYNKEDLKEGPAEGVYVHGLFLEGAGLDRRSGKLIESKPKVLYEQMPVIYIYAINTTAGKDPKLYECPIYRKPQRTDQKYVGSIDFETDHNPRHWTLRGVALLCDIK